MRTQRERLPLQTLSILLMLGAVGCGGGISDALSLKDSGSSLNGISVASPNAQGIANNAGKAASGTGAVTAQAFTTCPTDADMTPVDMGKIACMVGRYEGSRLDENWKQLGAADVRCYVTLMSDGRLTLSVADVAEHSHQFSSDKYSETPRGNFSSYQSKNRGSTDLSSFKTSPSILLESQIIGTGTVRWADYFGLMLGQGSDGFGSVLSVWVLESIIQDQSVRCGGVLTTAPSSNPSSN